MSLPVLKKITSFANPEIKRIKSLAQKKYREEEKVFITEGLRHAIEAAEAGWQFQTLVIEDGSSGKDLVRRLLTAVAQQNPLCLEVSAEIMETLTKRDNAQAVVSVLHQRWVGLSDIKSGLWVAMEEIRDPGNLGTIIRTADSVGAEGIILIGNTCDPYSLEAIRASMGSFANAKMARATRDEFASWAKDVGFQVVGTHLKATHDYREVAYTDKCILLMGNEQAGLTDELSDSCTHLVKIPMTGKADSLNVSVAAAVMMFEINRAKLKI